MNWFPPLVPGLVVENRFWGFLPVATLRQKQPSRIRVAMYALPACYSAIGRNAPGGTEKNRWRFSHARRDGGPMLAFVLDGLFGHVFVLICVPRGV